MFPFPSHILTSITISTKMLMSTKLSMFWFKDYVYRIIDADKYLEKKKKTLKNVELGFIKY